MAQKITDSPRVLVVGLGIAGTASALRLGRMGWDVTVLEKAPERRRGGYFIALFGTGVAAAERLGIAPQVPDRASPDSMSYSIDRRGRARPGLNYSDLPGKARMMVRGDIEEAAFNALPEGVKILYSSTPQAIRQDGAGVDVDILNTATDTVSTERFDLVVGADGLRSTVRRMAFPPKKDELLRLGYMIATFSLDEPIPGFRTQDSFILAESGRSVWIFSYKNRLPTVLFSYRTQDVDAEFKQTPIESLRAAYGPEPTGDTLGWLLDKFEKAPDCLFDSAEQVHIDRWHQGRVVLVGDAAWCLTLYSGMGASTGLAGADLLGTMLERHGGDIPRALDAWEEHLRPFIAYHVKTGVNQRRIFTPANRSEHLVSTLLSRLVRVPLLGKYFSPRKLGRADAAMKSFDIAAIPA